MTNITELAQRVKTEASGINDTQWYLAKPSEIRSLVEALEKAQRANAAQDDHINQQQDRIESLEKKNAELGKYAGELESRTVKLPTTRLWAGVTECYEKSDVIAAIRAASVEVSDD